MTPEKLYPPFIKNNIVTITDSKGWLPSNWCISNMLNGSRYGACAGGCRGGVGFRGGYVHPEFSCRNMSLSITYCWHKGQHSVRLPQKSVWESNSFFGKLSSQYSHSTGRLSHSELWVRGGRVIDNEASQENKMGII